MKLDISSPILVGSSKEGSKALSAQVKRFFDVHLNTTTGMFPQNPHNMMGGFSKERQLRLLQTVTYLSTQNFPWNLPLS